MEVLSRDIGPPPPPKKGGSRTVTPRAPRGPTAPPESTFDVRDETRLDKGIRIVQDKFRRVRVVQDEIIEQFNGLSHRADVYMRDVLSHGRIHERIRKVDEQHKAPLAEAMAEANVTTGELDWYLMARHAGERNAHIRESVDPTNDAGSGMTDAHAKQILSSVDRGVLDPLAARVDAMNNEARELWREHGMLSDEQIDGWAGYEHYVPLKGSSEHGDTQMRIGRGFDIRGHEVHMARGRHSLPESPLMHTMAQLEQAHVRAEKNYVAQGMYNLMREFPNPAYWKVIKGNSKMVRKWDPIEHEETFVLDNVNARDPSLVGVKVGGQQYFLQFQDPLLRDAMLNIGPEQLSTFQQRMGAAVRFLAMMATSANPEFVVTNASRDVQTAVMNLVAEQDSGGRIDGEAIAKQTLRDIPRAWRGMLAMLRDHEVSNPQWKEAAREYRDSGAQIGFFGLADMETRQADFDALLDIANGTGTGQMREAFRGVKDFIEHQNSAVENAARLATYVNARDAMIAGGVDPAEARDRAADLAKHLTVNFNKRGEIGAWLNTLYMFANASIQGTAQFARVLTKPKAQAVAGGVVGFAALLTEMNRMLGASDDDDDGLNDYDQIPQYVRERNFILMNPFADEPAYFTVPLPYGYNVFHVLGEQINSVAHHAFRGSNSKGRSPQQAAVELGLAALGSFNPIGFEQSDDVEKAAIKTAAPTLLKPVAQLAVNEKFYGGSIYQPVSQWDRSPLPDSARGKSHTPTYFKDVAQWINAATGGSLTREGGVDLSPETLRHWLEFTTSGAGRMTDRTINTLRSLYKGEDLPVKEIPFARRFYATTGDMSARQAFQSAVKELSTLDEELALLKNRERLDFRTKHRAELKLVDAAKEADRDIRYFLRERKAIEAHEKWSESKKKTKIERLEKKITRTRTEFLKEYRAAR